MKGFEKDLTMTSIKDIIKLMYALFSGDASSKWRLTVKPWSKKRSLPMNAQQHLWYGQIAKAKGDQTPLDIKNFCKDTFGIPILLNSAEYADKIEFLLHKLDYYKHSYDNRMKLIQCLSITSEFTTSESKEYCDNMIFYWNDLGYPIRYKDE
jgi:hypothetical protein